MIRKLRFTARWAAVGVLLGTGAIAGGAVAAASSATPAQASTNANTNANANASHANGAVDAWTASPTDMAGAYADKTVREIVHTSAAGDQVRLRLSNAFGTVPVTFDAVWVGEQATGASVVPGTNRQALFGGSTSVTVPVGADVLSDPVDMTAGKGENLAVSIHVAGGTGEVTGHWEAQQDGWYSDGDTAAENAATAYTNPVQWWFWLDAVTVRPHVPATTVVTLGDSITEGYMSTTDANHRYPDYLAARLGDHFAVANEGIGGNRVTGQASATGGRSGVNVLARLDRDVLAQPSVKTVIYMEGINDIGTDTVTSASQLIQADEQVIARVHAAGSRIIGGTMLPMEGSFYYSPQREQIREQVNAWIRTSGAFDGVVDFDAAVADPGDPLRILPAYDSGDHLHPNDAGYQAMADAVPLDMLTK